MQSDAAEMLTSIHCVEVRLQGVWAAVDEIDVGEIGLDEEIESGRRSRTYRNPTSEWVR
jgi:hypothetical protein